MIQGILQGVAQVAGGIAGGMIGGGAINAANNFQARGFDAANQTARQALGQAPSAPANPQAQQDAFQAFRDSTGYQFNMNEGLNAVGQRFAGSGAYQSGAAMKALQRQATGLADNTFGSYLNALQGQQQSGLGSAAIMSGNYNQFADRFGQNAVNSANNAANAAVAQGANKVNAIGSIAQGVGNMFGSSFGGGMGGGASGGLQPGYTAGAYKLGMPTIPNAPLALPSDAWRG